VWNFGLELVALFVLSEKLAQKPLARFKNYHRFYFLVLIMFSFVVQTKTDILGFRF